VDSCEHGNDFSGSIKGGKFLEHDCLLGYCWVLVALMMEAERTFETTVNFYQTTQRNIPEESYLHIRHVRTWNLSRKFLDYLCDSSDSQDGISIVAGDWCMLLFSRLRMSSSWFESDVLCYFPFVLRCTYFANWHPLVVITSKLSPTACTIVIYFNYENTHKRWIIYAF
jgi:hypothetical protein